MITQILNHYHAQSRNDKHHRFRSWEHCFSFFHEHRGDFNNEKQFDLACLQLAFYLASWGMMRGGTFLLQKDYRIHEYLIRDTIMNPDNERFYKAAFETSSTAYMGLDKLIGDVCRSYENHIESVNGKEEFVTVSDTLASKIILGIYACVPAYDRYFVDALRLFDFKRNLSEDSVLQLLSFYKDHESEFESCREKFNKDGCTYTPMKLIDMFFWQVGYLLDTTKDMNNNDLRNEIISFAAPYKVSKGKDSTKTYSNNLNISTQGINQTEFIRRYIKSLLENAQDNDQKHIDLISGDIHKELGLKNRMPSVCLAMTSINGYR